MLSEIMHFTISLVGMYVVCSRLADVLIALTEKLAKSLIKISGRQ